MTVNSLVHIQPLNMEAVRDFNDAFALVTETYDINYQGSKVKVISVRYTDEGHDKYIQISNMNESLYVKSTQAIYNFRIKVI